MVWAVLLLILAVVCLVLEVFIPSGGLLSLLTAGCAIGSIALAFAEGPGTGLVFLGLAVVGLPAALAGAFSVWPHTPMGRRFLLRAPRADEVLPDSPELRWLRSLVGHTARTKTPMLPAGAVELSGRSVNAVSEGLPLDAGTLVRVVEVRGNRVVVRPVEPEQPLDLGPADLAQPIERVAPDPFQEPLA